MASGGMHGTFGITVFSLCGTPRSRRRLAAIVARGLVVFAHCPRLPYAMHDAAKNTAPPASPGWDVVDLLGEIADIGRDGVRGGYSRHLFEPAELALRKWF